jgi:hypothetical protein
MGAAEAWRALVDKRDPPMWVTNPEFHIGAIGNTKNDLIKELLVHRKY